MNPRQAVRRVCLLSGAAIGLTTGIAPGVGVAQSTQPPPPTSQPDITPTARPGYRGSPFSNRVLRLSDILGPALRSNRDIIEPAAPADAEEWEEIAIFARQNFPNRWAQFEAVQKQRGEDSQVVQNLKERMTARYRTLQRVQQTMPNLYDAAVRQGKLEDDAWAASVEARRKPKDQAVQKKLREKIGALVKDVLQERQDRIDGLKTMLQDEQERLENDQKNLDGLIDRQIARITGDRPGDVDLPPRWNGGPGGGGAWGGGGGGWGGRWEGPPRGERRRGGPDNAPTSEQPPATQPN
jgi:hypothetical protein